MRGLALATFLCAPSCADEEVVVIEPFEVLGCDRGTIETLDWIPLGDFAASGDVVVRTGAQKGTVSLAAFPASTREAAIVAYDRGETELAIGRSPAGGLSDLRTTVLLLPRGEYCAAGSGLGEGRASPAVAALPDGSAIVVGGDRRGEPSARAEWLDPETGTLLPTRLSMNRTRQGATASALPDGRVLIAGGRDRTGVHASAEVYDVDADRFDEADPLTSARVFHAAVATASGVLVSGGEDDAGALPSAEIFDAGAEAWTAVGSLGSARGRHAMVVLPTGAVLVVGGLDGGEPVGSVERFDTDSRSFETLPGVAAIGAAVAATLPGGAVLAAGDLGACLVSPSGDVVDLTDALAAALDGPFEPDAAALLPDGTALVFGSGLAVRYSAASGFEAYPGLARARVSAATLAVGSVLTVGGESDVGGPSASFELLRVDLSSDFTTPAAPLLLSEPVTGLSSADPRLWTWQAAGLESGWEGTAGAVATVAPGLYSHFEISFRVSGEGSGFVGFSGGQPCTFSASSAAYVEQSCRAAGTLGPVSLGVAEGTVRYREVVIERK